MLYPFITEPDGTEIVYSDLRSRNGEDCVLVKFERWNDARDDFDSMECLLPDGKMDKVIGFTQDEAESRHKKMIHLQDMIIECSREDSVCRS